MFLRRRANSATGRRFRAARSALAHFGTRGENSVYIAYKDPGIRMSNMRPRLPRTPLRNYIGQYKSTSRRIICAAPSQALVCDDIPQWPRREALSHLRGGASRHRDSQRRKAGANRQRPAKPIGVRKGTLRRADPIPRIN